MEVVSEAGRFLAQKHEPAGFGLLVGNEVKLGVFPEMAEYPDVSRQAPRADPAGIVVEEGERTFQFSHGNVGGEGSRDNKRILGQLINDLCSH